MTVPGKLDRRFEQLRPRLRAELAMRRLKPLHVSGNRCRFPANDAVFGELAGRVEEHAARCTAGRLLAEIEEVGAAVGHAHQYVAASSEAGHPRMRHAENEAHC